MRSIVCLLLFIVVSASGTSPSIAPKSEQERFLVSVSSISFSTFTLIKSTTTITTTMTTTTTCTTSTNVLSTCTTGRRRRGLFYDESETQSRHRRAGLFYNDGEVENEKGTVFLPAGSKASDPVNEVLDKSISDELVIPLEIQPGFSLPEGAEANRFLLAFGVSTRTSFVFTTSTLSLTAICISTTGFPLCGGVGK